MGCSYTFINMNNESDLTLNFAAIANSYNTLKIIANTGLKMKPQNNLFATNYIAAFILIFFTIELGFKILTPNFKKTHNLKDLYLNLKSENRDYILNYVLSKMGINEIGFNNFLEANQNEFNNWRYLENSPTASIIFLENLVNALGLLILKRELIVI
jgi:hypothetical protein